MIYPRPCLVRTAFGLALALLLLTASGPTVRADKDAAAADVGSLVDGDAAFAFELYRRLAVDEGNLFFSPHSISDAMAMVTVGARGETAKALEQGMRFGVPVDRLAAAFHDLDGALRQPDARNWPHGEPLALHVANAFWAAQRFPFRPAYVDLLRQQFGAEARTADFAHATGAARREINSWVSEKTAKHIPELLAPDTLNPDTVLVLVNAIYFKASWKFPFEKRATRPAPFMTGDGQSIQVPTMHLTEAFRYASGEGWELLEIPYAKSHASMVIILPALGGLGELQQRLDPDTFASMLEGARHRDVRLALPRIRTRSRLDLGEMLAAMGMECAFGGEADFSGMSEAAQIFISRVIHEATLDVDESGTEAAAATAVVADKGKPEKPVEFRVDRPFLVVLRSTTTGAVLFLGHIVDPEIRAAAPDVEDGRSR